jgi:DNA-binding PadR family transcriptional regulator
LVVFADSRLGWFEFLVFTKSALVESEITGVAILNLTKKSLDISYDMFKGYVPFSVAGALQAVGRRPARFGAGRGGRGPDFMGGGGLPGGRKLSSADLQLVILAFLEKQRAHGYELIRAIEEQSNGFYVPSPGVIYPALTALEEIGRAALEQDGNRKQYQMTEAGRLHLEANRESAEAMLETLSRIGSRMEEVREAFAGLYAVNPEAVDEFHQASYALKHTLLQARHFTPDEARRIAAILERTVAEILSVISRKQT